jgi:hypothetical protein
VKPSPGKGLGVFASHALEVGSIIMREGPILRIPPSKYDKGAGYPISEVTELVRREYEKLSPHEQMEVTALTYQAHPAEIKRQGGDVLGFIFRTNAYNTGSGVGLFPRIARINHSCRPNAAYYWNEKLQKRIVYVIREIAEGEEIFVSFISLLQTRKERQKILDPYGFTCTCHACALPATNLTISDKRRTDISRALKAFQPQLTLTIPQHPTSFRKALKNAASSLELVELVEQEGLANYYAKVYRIVAISHARIKDWEKAAVWANKAYEKLVMEDPESRFTMEMYELTRRFIESWEKTLQKRV